MVIIASINLENISSVCVIFEYNTSFLASMHIIDLEKEKNRIFPYWPIAIIENDQQSIDFHMFHL